MENKESAMEPKHRPVMAEEITGYLRPQPGENFIDCTLGGGGHTMKLAKLAAPTGKVLAIDSDPAAVERVRSAIAGKFFNIFLINDNYKNLSNIVEEHWPEEGKAAFSGIIFDLGLSSDQLEDQSRGFSFQLDAPLDMRYGSEPDLPTAAAIVNNYSRDELKRILSEYGEERFAGRIADAIATARAGGAVTTTGHLADIVERAVPQPYRRGRIHPATKTFQALRITVNRELDNITATLPQAISCLKKGGRLAVLSYHSLEDKIVKNFFKTESRDCLCPPVHPVCRCGHKATLTIITKKAITPGPEEIKANPRSRSAKLRVAEKI